MAVAMNLIGIYKDLMAAVPPTLASYTSVPNSPELPCIYCGPPDELNDFSSYGSCTLRQTVSVVVSRANEETAQFDLVGLIGIELIARLLHAESENWMDIAFLGAGNFRSVVFGSTECLAADLNFTIRTT